MLKDYLGEIIESNPLSVDLDQYDVVSLTDALRGFLQELPVPIIPAAVYSELVYTAQVLSASPVSLIYTPPLSSCPVFQSLGVGADGQAKFPSPALTSIDQWESQSVEECGERLKRILECPSIPQANQQLLVHLTRHLARVSQHHQSGPRLLGQALSDSVFKHSPLSADVNPEHHVRILEALIATGGLMEIQTAPAFVSALVCNG
ncbi:hypothetical protein KUCAC02_023366 [Chaenocephalus aceratus]|uniref:Uncharacterized protein n=1 Tax=Chaenocephalus aceratus TaxID=36190 RepID=A0ACB9XPU8_CHAAC|nr:hypothetical protein KUCAC02_023366 [Chaenocephalus aceratus]